MGQGSSAVRFESPITLSNIKFEVIDDDFIKLPLEQTLAFELIYDGVRLVKTEGISRDQHGYWNVPDASELPTSDVLAFNVLKQDHKKLGSAYVELDTIMRDLQEHPRRNYDVEVYMDLQDSPKMRVRMAATGAFADSLATSSLWDKLSAASSSNRDYLMFVAESFDEGKWLNLTEEQILLVRTTCLSLPLPLRIPALLHCAEVLHFDYEPRKRDLFNLNLNIQLMSRMFYKDWAESIDRLDSAQSRSFSDSLLLLPETLPTKFIRMQWWGRILLRRYDRTRTSDVLEECLLFLEAVEDQPFGSEYLIDRYELYEALFDAHSARYVQAKLVPELDEALAWMGKAMAIPLLWHTLQQKVDGLKRFTVFLKERYSMTRDHRDLDRAIAWIDRALSLAPPADPNRLAFTVARTDLLETKLGLHSSEGSLTDVIALEEQRLAGPRTDAGRDYMATLFLVHSLFLRSLECEKRGDIESARRDVNRAIDLTRKFIDEHPDDLYVDSFLLQLASELEGRFLLFGDTNDLDEAILVLSPEHLLDSPIANWIPAVLGKLYRLRYIRCGYSLSDRKASIACYSHAALSKYLLPIQRFFFATAWYNWDSLMIGPELSAFLPLVIPPSLLPNDNSAARMEGLKAAMSILPSIGWIGMALHERHEQLTISENVHDKITEPDYEDPRDARSLSIADFPCRAAAFAIQEGELTTALEWLEQGRSVVWEQLLQLRTPLHSLQEKDAKLAHRMMLIREEIMVSSTQNHFWKEEIGAGGQSRVVTSDAEAQKHRKLATDWELCVAEARRLSGFERFLLPKDFEALYDAVQNDIVVVINVDHHGCDALVLFPITDRNPEKEMLHVPLPDLSIPDIEQMHAALMFATREDYSFRAPGRTTSDERGGGATPFPDEDDNDDPGYGMEQVLGDLWYKVVQPVLFCAMSCRPLLIDNIPGTSRAHVKWCPTGQLAFLPLHAAGDYSESESGHRVHDFVVSSYIPTLSSIIRPQSKPSASGGDGIPVDDKIRVLAVGCSKAEGQLPIYGVDAEVLHLRKHATVCPSSQFIVLADQDATAKSVIQEMQRAAWVHYACHGIQDTQSPADSALLLADGTRLKLSDIAAVDLPNAELAFLSACQTATGHEKLPSESVHLAAGMLLAGYRSVIATMWSIQDRYAPKVADDVYGYLLRKDKGGRPDYKESAIALHLAVERLRNEVGESAFLYWVPYIHIGA